MFVFDKYLKGLIMLLLRVFGVLALFTFTVIISPLVILFYLLCWIRATLTSIIYGFKKCTLLAGKDVMPSTEFYSNNSIINFSLLIKSNVSTENVKEKIIDKLINATDDKNRPLFPKFTKCLTLRAGYLMWSEAINFNIDEHIVSYPGQPPHNNDELKAAINDLCNQPMSPSRPCWQFIVIPLQFTQMTDDNSVLKTCVLLRNHHSIADGIAFSRILFEIVAGDTGAISEVHKQMYNKFKTKFRNGFMKKLAIMVKITKALLFTPVVMCNLKFNNDQRLPHNSRLSGIKIYDWSSPIKLSTIKEIKNATCTTVNDVVTSCLAAALRKVFLKQSACPPYLHSLFLVSLQNPSGPVETRNEMAFIHCPLPTGEMGCIQRLKTTKAIMDKLKYSPDVMATSLFFQYVCSIIPYRVVQWMFERTHQSVLMSNVPGPSRKLHCIGPIDEIIALPQIRHTKDFGVLVYSYADEVTVSVMADTTMINHKDNVRLLLKEFIEEIQELHNSINV